MKVILSRKGFDSKSGGCASPIMPDGTLLSLPIPEDNYDDNCPKYDSIYYKGMSYEDILKKLPHNVKGPHCHLDPDIRDDIRSKIPNWMPAFGQINSAQGVLRNRNVGMKNQEDLFLFFGWFKEVEGGADGYYRYKKNAPDLHIIYGYLQIEKVLESPKDQNEIAKYEWHPHAIESRLKNKTNALYIPRERLSFNDDFGHGVLNYSENRVLTMKDNPNRSVWKNIDALKDDNLMSERKNRAEDGGICYPGVWQELVLKENKRTEDWAKSIIRG